MVTVCQGSQGKVGGTDAQGRKRLIRN